MFSTSFGCIWKEIWFNPRVLGLSYSRRAKQAKMAKLGQLCQNPKKFISWAYPSIFFFINQKLHLGSFDVEHEYEVKTSASRSHIAEIDDRCCRSQISVVLQKSDFTALSGIKNLFFGGLKVIFVNSS